MVTMRRVKSSGIRAVGYDEDTKELWVEYHSSPGAYRYWGVPRDTFAELEEAESKGRYVNRMIKGRFSYEYRLRVPGTRSRPKGPRNSQP